MNIDVSAVNQVAGVSNTRTGSRPSHRICPTWRAISHSLPGWVNSYGIAP